MSPLSPFLLGVLLAADPAPGILSTQARDTANVPAPRHFVFFNRDRERIAEPDFLGTEAAVGAQLKYTWRELEPERDRYDFDPVLRDLAYLSKHGKLLFVQLQDVSFSDRVNVPDYLIEDPAFGGGVARQYEFDGDDESGPVHGGWVARRWDPAVIDRFAKLLRVLGEQLDGRIEGLNLPETAVEFGESGALWPEGFSYEAYADGVKEIMTAARDAFPRSVLIQYANFMPGEQLPENDRGYLRGIYQHAEAIGFGVGGPDLLPHRVGQQTHSLPLIAARSSRTPAGLAVQWGNLEDVDPGTGKPVTVEELVRFARQPLNLDYVFWGTQEPYYSDQILPFLNDLSNHDR